jgi:hypothetical protein
VRPFVRRDNTVLALESAQLQGSEFGEGVKWARLGWDIGIDGKNSAHARV